jgi:hypothetical protein
MNGGLDEERGEVEIEEGISTISVRHIDESLTRQLDTNPRSSEVLGYHLPNGLLGSE